MIDYICILLIIYIMGQAVAHRFERKDLYNRIMSRDVSDYKAITDKDSPKHHVSAHKRALNKWRNENSKK